MRYPIALTIVVLALLACLPTVAAGELRVPITITEPTGMSNTQVRISNGVPFLAGQVTDIKKLRVVADNGKEMVAQFRPLARWWRKDNSLRWVQVDFKTKLGGYQSKTFYITDGGTGKYDSPLKVTETDETLVIDTGVAQFTIDRKNFNFFQRVRLDHNRDGTYAQSEEIISPGNCIGGEVTDTYGQKYLASAGTTEVAVEESGPVRVCIVAKGVHRAPEGKGYSRGMYGYDVRMHFYANSSLVRLDTVMHNGFPKPTGSPTFDDYSLKFKLNLTAENQAMEEYKDVPPIIWAKVYGQAPLDQPLKAGESVKLYQDSAGTENWKVNPGIKSRAAGTLSSFRGYRVYRNTAGGEIGPTNGSRAYVGLPGEKVVTQGDHAEGSFGLGGKNFGIAVYPRYFWQKFPKAVEVAFDGSVRIGILPGEYKVPHFVEDAAGVGQEMWILFYSRGRTANGKYTPKGEYYRETKVKADKHRGLMRNRPKLRTLSYMLTPQVFALCSAEHYAACGALADIGPYLPIKDARGFAIRETERRYMTTDYLKGNAFGWQVFGCRWEECAGHTPYNYEPILSSDYLFQYILSRSPSWLEWGYRRNMHFRDTRAYKINGTDLWGFRNWKSFASQNVSEDWCKRAQPTGPEITKYSQGRYKRVGWMLPDPAHVCVDELYDLWVLFGDRRAYEGAANCGAVGGAFSAFRPGQVSRLNGWGMRTLMRYYDLTGDKKCLPYVNKSIARFWEIAVKNRSRPKIPTSRAGTPYDGWYNNITGRAIIMAYNATGDERMRDLGIGMAKGRANEKMRYPTLTAFAYDQTGDESYRYDKPEKFAHYWVNEINQMYSHNYYPACDGYLWAKPRPDKQAPAAVTDLSAQSVDGQVHLTWTAPGDDGKRGTATIYQVKWADLPVVETADGAGRVNFWAAENVAGEPKPSRAGARERFTVRLKPGRYHFAIKTRDELNNESPISNVVVVDVL